MSKDWSDTDRKYFLVFPKRNYSILINKRQGMYKDHYLAFGEISWKIVYSCQQQNNPFVCMLL